MELVSYYSGPIHVCIVSDFLNFSEIISKYRTSAVFPIFRSVNFIYHTICRHIFIYLHYKFHMPISNDSIVIATNPEAKFWISCASTVLIKHGLTADILEN
jgi:hypothetical protein